MKRIQLAVAFLLVVLSAVANAADPKPLLVHVDATQAPLGLLHAHFVFPSEPGPRTIGYPKWIPGEHAPTGPISQVVRLAFAALGKPLAWHRDESEPFAFHVEVPQGARELEADLDFACEIGAGGFTPAICSSYDQLVLNWNLIMLYDPSFPTDASPVKASLRLPQGWGYASPLSVEGETAGEITFAPTTVKVLVDSPLIAGAHFQKVPLGGDHPVNLDLIAEAAQGLAITPEEKTHFANLVAEATHIFGGSRYDHYEMELSLGDEIDHYTVEHFQASENRMPDHGLTDPRILLTSGSLVPHEYVHSWNGKWRPPVELDNPSYMTPVNGSLLWVYEGLTDYLGNILAARAGFWTPDQFRQSLAIDAAQMATHPGRTWRSLQDTTTGAQLLYNAPLAWSAARRATDFYPESGLIWLEADTIIREQTKGQKSLDDFCGTFFAPKDGHRPAPYTFDDVAAGMNAVAPYDWRAFFRERLDSTSPQPPFGGIERSGWKLTYSEEKTELMRDLQDTRKIDLLWPLWERSDFTDQRYSIGILVADDGSVLDSSPGMAAFAAGVVPGVRIVRVNGEKFSIGKLESAVKASKHGTTIELTVANGSFESKARLDYHEGARYPTLERISSHADMLGEILAPHAKR
ncbi:MAG TPA: hypothetical protein VK466_08720 [Terriglobales bacterium]|nr:hypothetical protein [Terriglobales bacterium]